MARKGQCGEEPRARAYLDDNVGDDRPQGDADEVFILFPPMRDVGREREEFKAIAGGGMSARARVPSEKRSEATHSV